MHRRAFIAAAVSAALVPSLAFAAGKKIGLPDPKASPEQIVRNLYDRNAAEEIDYLEDKPRKRYFTASTDKLLGKAFKISEKRQEPSIDYDPVIDGQDGDPKNIVIVPISSDATRAVVEARFDSFDEKVVVTYTFENEKGVWKIEDIAGRGRAGVRARAENYLKEVADEEAAAKKGTKPKP